MKKHVLSVMALFAIILTSITPVASATANECYDYALLSKEELAYCDLSTAPAEWQNAIVAARTSIILSQAWSIDGLATIIYPDGTEKVLPKFSDIFPGWDLPKQNVAVSSLAGQHALNNSGPDFAGRITLYTAKDDPGSPFYYFEGNGRRAKISISECTASTFNAGLVESRSGYLVGWEPDAPKNSYVSFSTISGVNYGARANTSDSGSMAWARVYN